MLCALVYVFGFVCVCAYEFLYAAIDRVRESIYFVVCVFFTKKLSCVFFLAFSRIDYLI